MSNMSNEAIAADASLIFSEAPEGMIVTMNAFVAPADQAPYLQTLPPIVRAMRANPENLFVTVGVNPTDAGHIRVIHGWKRDSKWFGETFYKQPYFKEFVEKTKGMWVRPRIIEHFDLVPVE